MTVLDMSECHRFYIVVCSCANQIRWHSEHAQQPRAGLVNCDYVKHATCFNEWLLTSSRYPSRRMTPRVGIFQKRSFVSSPLLRDLNNWIHFKWAKRIWKLANRRFAS